MRKDFLGKLGKGSLILALILFAGILLGCSVKNAESLYRDKYDATILLLEKNEYDEAKEGFSALIQEIDSETKQSDKLTELKADCEYALGYIAQKDADYYVSYDYYTSAYVYYKSLFQENGEKTIDARLQLAMLEDDFLERDDHALSEYTDVYELTDDSKYRNVALCRMTILYTDMDNRAETEERMESVKSLINNLSEKDLEKIKQEAADGKEKSDRNRLIGRIEPVNQYLAAYQAIGNYYTAMDEPEKAIEIYEEALRFISDNDIQAEPYRITYLESLGFINLYYLGVSDGNTYLHEAGEYIANSFSPGVERASHYIQIAELYLAVGNYDLFMQYMEEAEQMISEKKGANDSLIALCKVRMSYYYRMLGEYQLAVENCEKAIEIKKNLLEEDEKGIGGFYNNLANCYMSAGNATEAMEAYKEAREIYLKYDDKLQLAVVDRNMALVCNNTFFDHASALQYANEAIEIVDAMDHFYFGKTIASIYMIMPDILNYSDKEYPLIEDYSKKAYECLQNAVGNKDEEIAYYHYNLASYLSDNGRYKEALDHFLSAEGLFKTVYMEEKLYPVDIYYDIAHCYYFTGKYNEALKYFNKSVKYNDDHIDLMINQGNYNTSYWQECREKSTRFIEIIEGNQD